MKPTYRILSVFIILAIMISISVMSLAAKETKETNESDIAEIEKTFTDDKGNINREEVNGVANIAISDGAISKLVADISYTNPTTGISIFGKSYSNDIETTGEQPWTNYTFYLSIASYVHVGVEGIMVVGSTTDLYSDIGYILDIDNTQGTRYHYIRNRCITGSCIADNYDVRIARIFYLNKGYHAIHLRGNGDLLSGVCGPNGVDNCYQVVGDISLMAFPEYTAIKVTSPNGGENWIKGTTKSITWTKYGQPGANVKIELYKGSTINAIISSKTANDGSYSWYIPTYQPIGSDYKIKITSYEETKYYDWSNNYFKIS